MRRKVSLAVTFALVITGSLILLGALAVAIVTSSVVQGRLTVTSDEDGDLIVVRCGSNGGLKINGVAPGTGAVACADITSIVITGAGGPDDIDLHRVGSTEFTSLTSVSIDGGTESDVLTGSQLADTIVGDTGDDRITVDLAIGDVVDGGDGKDQVDAFVVGEASITDDTFTSIESLTVIGSEGNDAVDAVGYSGPLEVTGRGGDDHIFGGAGPNRVNGGDGNDVLVGGIERDRLQGGAGNDSVNAKGGNDFFFDTDGADLLQGGTGNDRFFMLRGSGNEFRGGPGSDLFHIETTGSARLTDEVVRAREGHARLASIDRVDLLLSPEFPSATLDARGFSGKTWIRGQSGDDVLLGGSGSDQIDASWGDDKLKGGAGRDRLDGFDGKDTCDGGPGNDRVINCEVT